MCGHCGRSSGHSDSKSSSNNNTTAALSVPTKMLRCSRCKAVHYCNKQHQALDWPTHKVSALILLFRCFVPFRLRTTSNVLPLGSFRFVSFILVLNFLRQLTCKAADAPPAIASKPDTPACTRNTAGSGAEQLLTADVNVPSELLTSPNIRITTPSTYTLHNKDSVATSAVCVYSAAKRDYLIQRSVLLLLSVMQDYLFSRNNIITTNKTSSTAVKAQGANVLVVAAAIEGIANIAFSAGPDGFQKYLMRVRTLSCLYVFIFIYVRQACNVYVITSF